MLYLVFSNGISGPELISLADNAKKVCYAFLGIKRTVQKGGLSRNVRGSVTRSNAPTDISSTLLHKTAAALSCLKAQHFQIVRSKQPGHAPHGQGMRRTGRQAEAQGKDGRAGTRKTQSRPTKMKNTTLLYGTEKRLNRNFLCV
ncbi:MAG: hypothetical protein AB7E47_08385 [Desulfovibrionaceae bacterium]